MPFAGLVFAQRVVYPGRDDSGAGKGFLTVRPHERKACCI